MRRVKYKHIKTIISEKPDFAKLMIEIFNYKNPKFGKRKAFQKCFEQTYDLVQQVLQVDPINQVELSELCDIKYPDNLEEISFIAMMELQSQFSRQNDILDSIKEVVAIACFESNFSRDFDIESKLFIEFKDQIDESSFLDIYTLFNIISKKFEEMNKIWESRFLKIRIQDPDYEMIAGNTLNSFNVINSIKMICKDFNVNYDRAWHLPYSLVQTNSLSIATQHHIQYELSKLKESKLKNKTR